ncbi:MAG: lysophospholipid acyltransferase family protein [Planctomycetota bacterium]|jgi:KDO2-lipid IV(A) lauroyltransferase
MRRLTRTRTHYGYLLLALLLRLARPRCFRVLFCRLCGAVGFRILPGVRRAVVANLEVVTGSRTRAVALGRRVFANYCLYLADYLDFPSFTLEKLRRRLTRIEGETLLRGALDGGRGVILVTPHLGNWETGGIFLSRSDFPMNVVSLPEEDERTGAYRDRMREKHGIKSLLFDPTSASMSSMVEMLNVLKRNEIVAMLTDRPTAGRLETVPFFGRPTPFPAGAFILSWVSGAPILTTCCVLRGDSTYEVITEGPILPDRSLPRDESIRRGVLEMVRSYESFIRNHPDQWYNFYPYWGAAS